MKQPLYNETFTSQNGIQLKEFFQIVMAELRADYTERITSLKEAVNLQFKANKIALDKAETSTNIRLENMNEFRGAISDANKNFVTRNEYDVKHQTLQNQLDDLRLFRAEINGKASQNSVIFAYVLGLAGLLFSIFDFISKIGR